MSANPDNHATEQVSVERLTAECPTHGTVPVHCPRCLGKRGGQRHKGTTWKRERLHRDMETARRVLDLQPEVRVLEEGTEERKRVYKIAEQLGWSKHEAELYLTDMRLSEGFRYLRELSDKTGMSPEERAKLREDMQKSIALALGEE